MRRGVLVAVLAALTVGVLPATAGAEEVVASGLDNPRHLAFGVDGALYIAEAGVGGEGPCFVGAEGEACFGASGAITRVTKSGQTRVVEGLPSLALAGGANAIGVHDVAQLPNKRLLATIGLGAPPEIAAAGGLLDGLGFAQLVQIHRGNWRTVADLGAFEQSNDPDGAGPDSNPYGLDVRAGRAYVTDAGANSVLSVRASGRVSTISVLPDTLADAPDFLGLPPGTQIPAQAVPTAIEVDARGKVYVAGLTGFPFPVGGASVFRIDGGVPVEVATGFTNVVDIAVGADGTMYVVELASAGLLSGDLTGALIEIAPDGTRTTTAGLFAPGGVAVGPDGSAYVTVCSVCADAGQVVKIG